MTSHTTRLSCALRTVVSPCDTRGTFTLVCAKRIILCTPNGMRAAALFARHLYAWLSEGNAANAVWNFHGRKSVYASTANDFPELSKGGLTFSRQQTLPV